MKLDPRSIKCVFLGYSRTQKGYRYYSPTLQRHFISADVTFDESRSYFSPSVASDSSPPCLPLLPLVSPWNLLRNHSRYIVIGKNLQQRFLPRLVIRLLILPLFQLLYVKVSVLVPLTSQFASYGHLSSSLHVFTTSLNSTVLPKSVQEAMSISG